MHMNAWWIGCWHRLRSAILALLMAAFLGLIAHFLIFRPLRNAAPLGKVVASVGLMLYLQGVALLNFGTSFPQPKAIIDRFWWLVRTRPSPK